MEKAQNAHHWLKPVRYTLIKLAAAWAHAH